MDGNALCSGVWRHAKRNTEEDPKVLISNEELKKNTHSYDSSNVNGLFFHR